MTILTDFPEELFDFAFFPEMNSHLDSLESLAEDEDWSYANTTTTFHLPVLYNYVKYTYRRIAEENKIAISNNGQFSCWNTGLVTESQEPIFASFEANRNENRQPWFFKGWFRRGQWELNDYSELPDIASYFSDPSQLVLDNRLEFRINVEHIIDDNKPRFPEPYSSMEVFQLQTFLKGAIDNARERVRRNYKAAIPQYYNGKIQLLLPLCFSNPQTADLALVIEKFSNFYRASTCLTVDMAYNNARQLARPDRDWLKP